MQVVQWLLPRMSAVNGHALVRVEPGEVADIEKMVKLVDGGNVGNFGFHAKIVSTGEMPEIRPERWQGKRMGPGYLHANEQFGFDCPSNYHTLVRYYEVFVNRD